MLSKPRHWLAKSWWGSLVAYGLMLATVYFGAWRLIEPLGIPDIVSLGSQLPRGLVHVMASAFVAAHATLALDLWLRKKSYPPSQAMRVGRDPSIAVSGGPLTFAEVDRALRDLTAFAREYKPNAIVGINRGGAIVGGCIAKQIGLPYISLLAVNCDAPPGRRVIEIQPPTANFEKKKVLLVDDAMRKGEHMREARSHLAQRCAEIRTAVVLRGEVVHYGPERKAFQQVTVDKFVYSTTDASVRLPWDPGLLE